MSTKLSLADISESNIIEQRSLWKKYENVSPVVYPRPQGKLPASLWLYKQEYTPKNMYDFKKSVLPYQSM